MQADMKDELNRMQLKDGLIELTDEEIRGLQEALLGIYSDVFAVCEKYGLKLFLQGGTLLGKVRHNGFIPWDDDMDLGMLRRDYTKFIRIFDHELAGRYELRAPRYRGGASERFIHIYKKGTYIETMDMKPEAPRMLNIDIFPVDYAPDRAALRFLKGVLCNGLMFIASSMDFMNFCTPEIRDKLRKSLKGRIHYLSRSVTAAVFRPVGRTRVYAMIDKAAAGTRKTGYLTSSVGRKHYLGEMQPRETFLPLKRTEFCGCPAWTLHDADAYLRHNYGDAYMEVPPPEKRERHFVKRLEL